MEINAGIIRNGGHTHEDEKGGESCDATIESNHYMNLEPNHQCGQQNIRKFAQNPNYEQILVTGHPDAHADHMFLIDS